MDILKDLIAVYQRSAIDGRQQIRLKKASSTLCVCFYTRTSLRPHGISSNQSLASYHTLPTEIMILQRIAVNGMLYTDLP
jgi:hypothetical protein